MICQQACSKLPRYTFERRLFHFYLFVVIFSWRGVECGGGMAAGEGDGVGWVGGADVVSVEISWMLFVTKQ